nr:peptide chain release factor 1 [Oxalobacteraceae bacterium]
MTPSLLIRLEQLKERLDEVNALLAQENATTDMDQYRKLSREHAELEPLVALHGQWQ